MRLGFRRQLAGSKQLVANKRDPIRRSKNTMGAKPGSAELLSSVQNLAGRSQDLRSQNILGDTSPKALAIVNTFGHCIFS